MEQLYMVEIFIDKVTIFPTEDESNTAKNLTVKVKFGPKVQFIIKEGQLARKNDTNEKKDDIVECDEQGRRKWSRTIRVGKSYVFPSYSDTILMILNKFPLEIEIWDDDMTEGEIFIGIGTMQWDTEFYHMLKETGDATKLHEPLTIKQITPIFAECCCRQCGEIALILRLSALGDSIITEFQQLDTDPEAFVFRTNKAPSMFQCKRVEGDDPNFCMIGSLYETATLEDPDLVNNANTHVEVCTELQSCGVTQTDQNQTCEHLPPSEREKKSYPIDKVRMGDITGPCGNSNCPLAHKVRTYIRNLDSYKKHAGATSGQSKDKSTRKICGSCYCKDERWHRDSCPTKTDEISQKKSCTGCGGVAPETCEERQKKLDNVENIAYVFNVTEVLGFKESERGKEYLKQNLNTYGSQYFDVELNTSQRTKSGCCCKQKQIQSVNTQVNNFTISAKGSRSANALNNNVTVYNLEKTVKPQLAVYNCTNIPDEKECHCDPPVPDPPCKTFDCDCLIEAVKKTARKTHKPYCPQYKHKDTCPVLMMSEEEELKKENEDQDDTEPLPYGLPPIQLGPCPVLGRPCTVPDGFARMYKTAALPPLPPSYSDAGKVCCSKEYEKIKSALKDYLQYQKDHDFRCINKFNVDTERRCCDKEQILMSLTGKSCCGSHKLAIQKQDE